MFVVPFHLVVPDHDIDILGVIRLTSSRRVKTKCRVHVSVGDEFEHVMDVDCADTWDIDPVYYVAKWLDIFGYTEEYFGVDLFKDLPDTVDSDKIKKMLEPFKATIRTS